jgi:hypothetical protein
MSSDEVAKQQTATDIGTKEEVKPNFKTPSR